MSLLALLAKHKYYDQYLKYYNENPNDYKTLKDKFIRLANIFLETNKINKFEIKIVKSLFFKDAVHNCRTYHEIILYCNYYSNPKMLGLKFVKDFIKLYNSNKCNIFVKGGAAAFLHILECKNIEIDLNDIDFEINTNVNNQYIYERLVEFTAIFCKKYDLLNYLKFDENSKYNTGYIIIHLNGKEIVKLNYFINYSNNIPPLTLIDNIFVTNIKETYEHELLVYNNTIVNNPTNYGKINRKREAIEHLIDLI
jgi:hypothetical protein